MKNIFKTIKLLVVLLLLVSKAEAQQLPVYNQFKYNQFVLNPALSGSDDKSIMALIHRNQWIGVDGAPETSLISFNGKRTNDNVGYSGYLYHDQTGILQTTSFYGGYSFSFLATEGFRISLGLSVGVINEGINKSEIVADRSDIVYAGNTAGKTEFDFNAGVNFNFYNFDIGFSAPQLFENSIDYAQELRDTSVIYNLNRHYIGSMKYTYDFEMKQLGDFGKQMSLVPQVLVRYTPEIPVQVDGHLMLDMRKLGWLSGGYRTHTGPMASLGMYLTDDLAVGYATEFNMSNVSRSLGSTHELTLVYNFGNNGVYSSDGKGSADTTGIMSQVRLEIEKLRQEELVLMKELEERMIKRMDSIADALRNDIVINANQLIVHKEKIGGEEDDIYNDMSTIASNVVAGSRGYYIVAGVFAYRKNAEDLNTKLVSEGYDVEYFYNRANNFYYVFLRKYKTYESALKLKSNNINGTYFDELWIKEVQ
ncbi:MAG: PorP/SprF family type IX secretion system membrane protein [Ichthyobacteriaceae bacterium]|nr:PorP/SprF family type IX secretion system membrane protein [Ichthyobacteriaceae bacterium]